MASKKGSVSQHKLTAYFPWDTISVGLPAKKSVSQAELKSRVAAGTRRIIALVGGLTRKFDIVPANKI
jgi:hypothetical protein